MSSGPLPSSFVVITLCTVCDVCESEHASSHDFVLDLRAPNERPESPLHSQGDSGKRTSFLTSNGPFSRSLLPIDNFYMYFLFLSTCTSASERRLFFICSFVRSLCLLNVTHSHLLPVGRGFALCQIHIWTDYLINLFWPIVCLLGTVTCMRIVHRVLHGKMELGDIVAKNMLTLGLEKMRMKRNCFGIKFRLLAIILGLNDEWAVICVYSYAVLE